MSALWQESWRRVRRALYLIHRWLGIVCCVLFVLWFISGLVMLHVRFPRLLPQERLEGLSALPLHEVKRAPAAALSALGIQAPRRIVLEHSLDRPVWRVLDEDGGQHVVSAAMAALPATTPARAQAIAAAFARRPAQYRDTVVNDQWTLPNANDFDKARPLHKIAVDDGLGTWLYVSAKTGEVVRDVSAFERRWTVFGTLLHYYTYAPIRRLPEFWRALVMWTSGTGMVVAVTGLWIGILRVRFKRRYRGGTSSTPYRGWMAWHHVFGLIGGVTILTWVFSGWFSMGPNRWLSHATSAATHAEFAGARAYYPHDVATLLPLHAETIKAVDAAWYAGEPVWVLSTADGGQRAIHAQTGAAISVHADTIAASARRAWSAPLAAAPVLIETQDRYWYHRHVAPVLPVWRVMLDDRERTWLHVDARSGQLLATSSAASRLRRWLFNGLHSLDFPGFMKTTAWYVTIWALSLAGLVVSLSGIVIGWRRLAPKPPRTQRKGGTQHAQKHPVTDRRGKDLRP